MTSYKSLSSVHMLKWVLLPLRLFLGITFIYAGLQKLTDPQFFQPAAAGYIGKQIAGFATSSPLHGFLLQFVEPHATLFGLLVAYGEIAIGLATLLGLFLRPAAFFGLLLSMIFYLSATWRVYPYFYGSDIVFVVCWLTMLLNGPLNTGLPALDERLSLSLIELVPPQSQAGLAHFLNVVLGTADLVESDTDAVTSTQIRQISRSVSGTQQRRMSDIQRIRERRRNFLMGTLTGGLSTLTLVAFVYAWQVLKRGANDDVSQATVSSSSMPQAGSTAGGGTSAATGTPAAGGTIAQVSAVPHNSAVSFTIPSTGDPGVLVHLNNGQFVAYDALCTHAGCQVDYDPSSQLLLCPCHGAAFDPAKGGAVVQPPASTPLAAVTIRVDSATGAIKLSS
ncbi:MAG: Rieske 2Fe-2S domain-containing protein [Chloroflexi bacterium]|nr:Rieske 2Fe-2S domain-containing protein [Chloroflexota bacterium]